MLVCKILRCDTLVWFLAIQLSWFLLGIVSMLCVFFSFLVFHFWSLCCDYWSNGILWVSYGHCLCLVGICFFDGICVLSLWQQIMCSLRMFFFEWFDLWGWFDSVRLMRGKIWDLFMVSLFQVSVLFTLFWLFSLFDLGMSEILDSFMIIEYCG